MEQCLYIGLLRDIANVSTGATAGFGDFSSYRRGVAFVEIENANRGARRCEFKGCRPPNATAAAGDDCGLPVEPELS